MNIRYILSRLKYIKWRKYNKHNFTCSKTCNLSCVKVGNNTYGKIDVFCTNYSNKLIIGNYCSIADEVLFILDGEHSIKTLSTYPFNNMILKDNSPASSKGNIVIDDDVWIGQRSTILSGVHIGQGAVVAAGSVVVNDIPAYSIVGGVPAKVIKYRFDSNTVQNLLELDFSQLTDSMITEHISDLEKEFDSIRDYQWMPRRKKRV